MPLITTSDAAEILASPPDGLVVLDVRTPEEFSEGRLEGATQLDFYDNDFAERLASLETSVPYLVYCRSGGRSAKAAEIMAGLGFGTVYDVDGGMLAWNGEGRPTVA